MTDDAAALHLFRVSAGLDSLIPGESEILGQVRAAYDAASPGPLLDRVFRQALQLGKRVRTETAIGESPASVPAAAAALAAQVFGDLSDRRVLLVGAGRIGELAAGNLSARGASIAYVANRSAEGAAELAERFGGERAAPRRGRGEARRGRRGPHLDRRARARDRARRRPGPPPPAAVLHRHRRTARRRPRRPQPGRLLPLRHRRSRGGRLGDARGAPGRGRGRRAARDRGGRALPRVARLARRRAGDLRAALLRRGDPFRGAREARVPVGGGAATPRRRHEPDLEQAAPRADRADEAGRRGGRRRGLRRGDPPPVRARRNCAEAAGWSFASARAALGSR